MSWAPGRGGAWAGPASPLRKLTLRGRRLSLSHPQTEPVRGPQHLPPCVSGPCVPRLPAPLRSGPSCAARGANPTCTPCPSALPPRAGALASGSRGAGRKQDDAGGHPLPGALHTELLEGGLCPQPGHRGRSHAGQGLGPGCQEGPSLICRPPILPCARAPPAKATGGCCGGCWVSLGGPSLLRRSHPHPCPPRLATLAQPACCYMRVPLTRGSRV